MSLWLLSLACASATVAAGFTSQKKPPWYTLRVCPVESSSRYSSDRLPSFWTNATSLPPFTHTGTDAFGPGAITDSSPFTRSFIHTCVVPLRGVAYSTLLPSGETVGYSAGAVL